MVVGACTGLVFASYEGLFGDGHEVQWAFFGDVGGFARESL
jgi:hypothetical protein